MGARMALGLFASFNPRAREGRDLTLRTLSCASACFNPRAREGRDPSTRRFPRLHARFNPRAREGRDAGGVGCE